jgi:integrin-linked kinase
MVHHLVRNFIVLQMLEGRVLSNMNFDKSTDFELRFQISRCPNRIQQ